MDNFTKVLMVLFLALSGIAFLETYYLVQNDKAIIEVLEANKSTMDQYDSKILRVENAIMSQSEDIAEMQQHLTQMQMVMVALIRDLCESGKLDIPKPPAIQSPPEDDGLIPLMDKGV